MPQKSSKAITPVKFAQDAIAAFVRQITDQVMLFVESDKKLMEEFLHAVDNSSWETVNQQIALKIEKTFGLEVEKQPSFDPPRSKLLQTYSSLRVKSKRRK